MQNAYHGAEDFIVISIFYINAVKYVFQNFLDELGHLEMMRA